MRLLLLTQWFPPEPRDLFLQLAQGFQAAGFEVTVVTGFPNWPGGVVYPGYKIKLCQRETIGGVSVLRLPIYPDHGKSAVKRAMNLTTLGLSLILLAPFLLRRQHVIYVVQLPTLVGAARWLSLFWRSKIVLEVQDLWPESLVATGMASKGRIIQQVSKLCSWAYKKCSLIRVISPGFQKNLAAKGVPESKLRMVPNWIDCKDYPTELPNEALKQKMGMKRKFSVLYAGSIGRPQGLEVVVSAGEALRDDPEIEILLAGDGVEREAIMQKVAEAKLTNVRYLGKFNQSEMPSIYAQADALLVHLLPDPLFAVTIPSKIVSYLASGRPVIAGLEGDPLRVVLDAGAGVGCKPGDGKSLAEAIKTLFSLSQSDRDAMGERGRQAALTQYDSSILLPRMAEIVTEVMN